MPLYSAKVCLGSGAGGWRVWSLRRGVSSCLERLCPLYDASCRAGLKQVLGADDVNFKEGIGFMWRSKCTCQSSGQLGIQEDEFIPNHRETECLVEHQVFTQVDYLDLIFLASVSCWNARAASASTSSLFWWEPVLWFIFFVPWAEANAVIVAYLTSHSSIC